MKLIIEQQDAQAIADYLVNRPYNEVAHLIPKLTQLQPQIEKPMPPSPDPGSKNGNGAAANENLSKKRLTKTQPLN